jgi:hypothetical protein
MRTVALILQLAAPLEPGFQIKIENEPWMNLVIEDTQELGPNGLPVISVAHYGEENGDLMRDPEMLFEMEKSATEVMLTPFYWRNDYAGIEQYSVYKVEGQVIVNAKLRLDQLAFARTWDANLRAQGFIGAFLRQQKGDT